ncbi:MAG: hypothetical protein H6653_03880 [Ardenticatenaceae bacterium]|nr:hypothetical protein [Ardenticatenaceae bacterium]
MWIRAHHRQREKWLTQVMVSHPDEALAIALRPSSKAPFTVAGGNEGLNVLCPKHPVAPASPR